MAYGYGDDAREALSSCLRNLQRDHHAALGVVYATDALAEEFGSIVESLREHTCVPHWTGAVGMGICAGGREFYDSPALAVMLLDIEPAGFKLFHSADELFDLCESSRSLQVALCHADPRWHQLADFIYRIPERLENTFMLGGLASTRGAHTDSEDVESSVEGVLFGENVSIVTALTQGCSLIGAQHEITECDENVILSLDNHNALEIFKQDIGEPFATDLRKTQGQIFAAVPVPGDDRGAYQVRNIMELDESQGAVAIGEYVQRGDPLMFCRRDAQSAMKDLQRMLQGLKKRIHSRVKGGIYITCIGRGRSLFGENSRECQWVQEAFDVPIIGFYANGELSGQRLFAYSGVLCLFLHDEVH